MDQIIEALTDSIRNNKYANFKDIIETDNVNINVTFNAPTVTSDDEHIEDTVTLLIFAILYERYDIAKYLIENGADVNMSSSREGVSPLLLSVEKDNIDLVQILLDKGADPNRCSYTKYCPLTEALSRKYLDIVKLLLNSDRIDVNIESNVLDSIVHPLMIVIDKFDGLDEDTGLELIELMIKKGANVNARINHRGVSVLMFAIERANFETVKLIVDSGADVNLIDGIYNEFPLIYAVFGNDIDVIKYLLDNGADTELQTGDGTTALLQATLENKLEAVKTLVEGGANLNHQNAYGDTALLIAIKRKNKEIVNYLISRNVDPNIRNNANFYPLQEAVRWGDIDVVKNLVNNGASTDDLEYLISLASNSEVIDYLKECSKPTEGGYYNEYKKYKLKYLQLKNKLHIY